MMGKRVLSQWCFNNVSSSVKKWRQLKTGWFIFWAFSAFNMAQLKVDRKWTSAEVCKKCNTMNAFRERLKMWILIPISRIFFTILADGCLES